MGRRARSGRSQRISTRSCNDAPLACTRLQSSGVQRHESSEQQPRLICGEQGAAPRASCAKVFRVPCLKSCQEYVNALFTWKTRACCWFDLERSFLSQCDVASIASVYSSNLSSAISQVSEV